MPDLPDTRIFTGPLCEPYGPNTEPLASWVTAPFARWAGVIPTGCVLPRALVAWVLDPPGAFWFGHHCGACGLSVPLRLLPFGDFHPPADLRAFPLCPGCGGPTSHAAGYRPDGAADTSGATTRDCHPD